MLPDKALSHLICATSSTGSSVHWTGLTLHTQRKRPTHRWQQMAVTGEAMLKMCSMTAVSNNFLSPTYWFQGICHYPVWQHHLWWYMKASGNACWPDTWQWIYLTVAQVSPCFLTDLICELPLGFFTSHNLHFLTFLPQQIWKSWKYQGGDFAEQLLQCPWTFLRTAEKGSCSAAPDPTIWQWLNSALRSSAQ